MASSRKVSTPLPAVHVPEHSALEEHDFMEVRNDEKSLEAAPETEVRDVKHTKWKKDQAVEVRSRTSRYCKICKRSYSTRKSNRCCRSKTEREWRNGEISAVEFKRGRTYLELKFWRRAGGTHHTRRLRLDCNDEHRDLRPRSPLDRDDQTYLSDAVTDEDDFVDPGDYFGGPEGEFEKAELKYSEEDFLPKHILDDYSLARKYKIPLDTPLKIYGKGAVKRIDDLADVTRSAKWDQAKEECPEWFCEFGSGNGMYGHWVTTKPLTIKCTVCDGTGNTGKKGDERKYNSTYCGPDACKGCAGRGHVMKFCQECEDKYGFMKGYQGRRRLGMHNSHIHADSEYRRLIAACKTS